MGLVAVLVAGFVFSGCIKSRCFQNADCGLGEVCDRQVGTCFKPECLVDVPCPSGSFCEDYRCVAGCAKDEECQEGQKCIDARCLPFREECNCLAATDFCLADRNPNSASYLQKVCVSDHNEVGVALFFGSVGCSHCWHLYGQLREMQQELAGEGFAPSLMFINIKSVDATPDNVAKGMSDVTTPIVQDGEAVGFWDAYLADWYHFVLVDRSGCIAAHYGPLSSVTLDGEEGVAIRAAWKAAMAAECTQTEVDADSGGDTGGPDGGPDLPDLKDVGAGDVPDSAGDEEADPAPADVPDLGDLPGTELPELVDGTSEQDGGDETEPQDVPPFQLAELCQVVQTEPVALGGWVPFFLCMDRNSNSAGYLDGFSTWSLSEMVWIAYFGACT